MESSQKIASCPINSEYGSFMYWRNQPLQLSEEDLAELDRELMDIEIISKKD